MSRISKADVNAALSIAAKAIIDAGGPDGRTSRADVKKALAGLAPKERALTDIFFKFIDNRDFRSGAQVTAKDVNRAVAYAKTHMIAKYDLNSNGLSKSEISKMSLTGRRAVDLAKALKSAAAPLDTKQLGTEIAKFADKATYMSEGDYNPEYFAVPFPAGHDLNGHNVMTALQGPFSKLWEGYDPEFSPGAYAAEAYTAKEAKDFIDGLGEFAAEDEDYIRESAQAFGSITKLLKDNLTDLKVFKIGPKDEDTGKLGVDQGLYAQVIIGRNADGKVAGVFMGDVET